jgi:hypothetical protein
MKKIIESLRLKIGLWLLVSPKMTATATELMRRREEMQCIHCGKNPLFKDLRKEIK